MKQFEKQKLNLYSLKRIKIVARILRIVLFPIFLLIRIYCWVDDYDYDAHFNR